MAEFRKLYKLVNFVHDQNHQNTKNCNLHQLQMQRAIGVGYITEPICLSYLAYECTLNNDRAHEVLDGLIC